MRVFGAVCTLFAATSAPVGAVLPTPIGTGPLFHPGARSTSVSRGSPIGRLSCTRADVHRDGVHLELFAHGRGVIVPAGIGVAPPLLRKGAYVVSGRCSYPVRTREPTGVIELERSARLTLGDFFAVWQEPLTSRRLAGFHADSMHPVSAFVDGRLYGGPPASIRLRRHAEIVLEIGTYVPPHVSYRFREGL